jgi:hypothetical protein
MPSVPLLPIVEPYVCGVTAVLHEVGRKIEECGVILVGILYEDVVEGFTLYVPDPLQVKRALVLGPRIESPPARDEIIVVYHILTIARRIRDYMGNAHVHVSS